MAAVKSGPRLGILGGTFDPIHYGHLRLAEEVGESLNLEHVYLIPAAQPPHKGQRRVSPFQHRFEMTRIASAESPLLKVLDLEARYLDAGSIAMDAEQPELLTTSDIARDR